jgi:RHS repeat-associated protein
VLKKADGVSYIHDADGNMIQKLLPNGETWTYLWDGVGQLSKVIRSDGQVVSFAYDALGRRVRKTSGQQTTAIIWDGNDVVHEIRTDSHVITWEFEPDTFAPVAKLEGRRHYAFLTDHLGTPLAAFDEAGEVAWKAQLNVHGVAQIDMMRTPCPWRWPGQYEDEETGLFYNRFRYYDPEAGHYISQDPIRLLGGTKLFQYVRDPNFVIDPLGLAGLQGAMRPIAKHLARITGKSVCGQTADHQERVTRGTYKHWADEMEAFVSDFGKEMKGKSDAQIRALLKKRGVTEDMLNELGEATKLANEVLSEQGIDKLIGEFLPK